MAWWMSTSVENRRIGAICVLKGGGGGYDEVLALGKPNDGDPPLPELVGVLAGSLDKFSLL